MSISIFACDNSNYPLFRRGEKEYLITFFYGKVNSIQCRYKEYSNDNRANGRILLLGTMRGRPVPHGSKLGSPKDTHSSDENFDPESLNLCLPNASIHSG